MKKILSILLTLFLLTTPTYAKTSKGNYIVISNQSTDPYTTQQTGKFQTSKNTNQIKSKTSTPNAIDIELEYPNNLKLYQNKSRNIKTLEATREFTTVNFITNQEEIINTDLKYSGKKVDIWVHEHQISDAQAIIIGQEFDNKIHTLINTNFGEESDVDGNSKINILIYDIKDNFEKNNSFIQGYFKPADLYNTSSSNKGEVIYIDTYPTMDITDEDGNQGIESLYPIIVHEFQHMVSFNENVIKENGQPLDTWINEGLSLAAEAMYKGSARLGRIEYYNKSNSIQNGHSLLYWDKNSDTIANYSLSYLFMEYLNIQSNTDNSIYKEIIQNKNNDYIAIEDVVKKYIDSNTNFGEFMTDFRVALVLNQSSGKYGFKGKEGFDKIQKRIYKGSEVNLRGGGAVVIKSNGVLDIPTDKGNDIIYVGSEDIEKIEKSHIKIIGENRYDTAVKISREAFKNESDVVILINGKNSSDGLSAGPFASLINASMLLVEKDYIPKETIEEIIRLNPKTIYLIGGKDVISDKVKDEIQNIIDINSNKIKRIGGFNREETSLLIGKEILNLSNNMKNIYVVNGYKGEADAMSILSKACNEKSTILITNGNKLSKEQINFIKSIEYPNFYFIGGNSVINNNLLNEVESLFDVEVSIMRVYGDTRQDTNSEILNYFYRDNIKSLIVAKSDNLIDALCVGVFAGKNNIPVVIASNGLSYDQSNVIKNKNYDTLIEVGGGINSKVINALK